MASDNRFAVLIDADNVSVKYIKIILDELSKDGVATYKRIYGDWTNPSLISWKSVLLDNSITPIQQYSYTTREKLHRLRHDHRRHGHPLLRQGGRLLPGVLATATSPGWPPGCGKSGMIGDWHGREQDP